MISEHRKHRLRGLYHQGDTGDKQSYRHNSKWPGTTSGLERPENKAWTFSLDLKAEMQGAIIMSSGN